MDPNNTSPTGAETTPTPDANTTPTEPTNTVQNIWDDGQSGSISEPNQTPQVPSQVGTGDPAAGGDGNAVPAGAGMGGEQQPQTPQLSPEQIAQIAAQAGVAAQQQAQPQQQQPQQRQYTPEELNHYSMDEAVFEKIFGSEDKAVAIAAFNEVLQGVVKQAFTMAHISNQNMLQDRFGQLDQQLAPHLSFAQQQQEAMAQEQFYQAYPDLRGMDQVVQQVVAQMHQQPNNFKSQQEAFAEVAKRTQAIIQHISGGQAPQGGVGNQGQTPPQGSVAPQGQQKPGMAAVGAGGTGGAGGGQGAGSAKPKSTAESIFG